MTRKLLIILFAGQLLFSGCAFVGAIFIATSADCKIDINDKCIDGSCDLINGVFFEKLTMLEFDQNGIPREYIVTERFQCYNPGVDGVQTFWPDKLYFNKVNGYYRWALDTVNVHYKMNGHHREIISKNKAPGNYNETFILDSDKYEICPVEIHEDAWYNIKISDPRVADVYLYVDSKGRYHTFQFDSGVSPI